MWLLEGPSANELWSVNCHCGQTAGSLEGSPALPNVSVAAVIGLRDPGLHFTDLFVYSHFKR